VTRTPSSAVVTLSALVCASALLPHAASGQLKVDWYTLGVGSYAGASDFLDAGSTLLGRGRTTLSYVTDWAAFDVAYEHVLQRQPAGGGFSVTSPGGGSSSSTGWLPLDWTLYSSTQTEWRHRFDRLSFSGTRGGLEATVGRQAISWATTLFLTPSDPFAPFDPSDPFREYRGGVDAIRVRVFPGPFTEIEAVFRPTDTPTGTTMTALGRIGTSKGGWALGGWAGLLHDEAAGALFASGGIGATVVRAEFSLREGPDEGTAIRAAVGLDRLYTPGGNNLYVLGEVQYDGFGAAGPNELIEVALSEPFARGDMQTLGRWTVATQISYQLHPLVGVDALTLMNVDDLSWLFAPGVSWSMTSYASARLGLFRTLGEGASGPLTLGSEYGSVPTTGYVSVSMFF
jgi:hypothetical protein